MIPKVNIPILHSQNSPIGITSYSQYLSTANFPPPNCLKLFELDYTELSFGGPKHKVILIVVTQIIAGCYLGNLIFFLGLYKDIVVFKLFVFCEVPKMDLVTADCRELELLAFSCVC